MQLGFRKFINSGLAFDKQSCYIQCIIRSVDGTGKGRKVNQMSLSKVVFDYSKISVQPKVAILPYNTILIYMQCVSF